MVLEADSNLQTLLDFKYKRLFAADDGRRGGPNKCTGASGKDPGPSEARRNWHRCISPEKVCARRRPLRR